MVPVAEKYQVSHYALAGVLHAKVVLVALEADTAALVCRALLAVEERTGEVGGVNEAGGHGIAFEGNLRRGSQGAVFHAVVRSSDIFPSFACARRFAFSTASSFTM